MHNIFEQYIFDRINKGGYRGVHLAQHNRLPFDKVLDILKIIYDIVDDDRFRVHIGDDEGGKQEGCEVYYKIVGEVEKKLKQGTINSLKKNIFPDLDRMGFIVRYDKDGLTVIRDEKSSVAGAKLSELGVKFVKEKRVRVQYAMYVNATDKLLEEILDELFYILYTEFESVSVYEFMFILSDKSLGTKAKIDLIRAYRRFGGLGQIKVRKDIFERCEVFNKSAKDKTGKRDFGNWYNQALEIFSLLNQTVYFKTFRKTVLMLGLSQEALEFIAIRSADAKVKALEWHEIKVKSHGYVLHHIYPIDYATCKKDLEKIDDFRNLIYISNEVHRKIPTRNNLFVKFNFDSRGIYLINPFVKTEQINVAGGVLLDKHNLQEMVLYNRRLINAL